MVNQSNKLSGPFLIDIKNKFREIAGDDNKIDREEFHESLLLSDRHIVDRIFDIFDKDKNEYIDANEFIEGVQSLIKGGDIDKIRFAFDIHDFDQSGDIDRFELKQLIKNILTENSLEYDVNQVDLIVDEFYKIADLDHSGTIDFEEFLVLVKKFPDLVSSLAVNPVNWFNPLRKFRTFRSHDRNKIFKRNKIQLEDLNVLQWLLVPRLIYFYNIILNRSKNRDLVSIKSIKLLPERNISIVFDKPSGFNYSMGDYVYINCPWISKLEWYPFSIISHTKDDNIIINIKGNGEWSNKIYEKTYQISSGKRKKDLDIRIDGPYGSSSQILTENENVILVGAETGVSKFASIMQDIALKVKHDHINFKKLKRLFFIWLTDDMYYYEWLKKTLHDIKDNYRLEYFNYNIFFVERNAVELPNKMLYISKDILKENINIDLINYSGNNIFSGVPEWSELFSKIKKSFGQNKIALNYSGPKKYKRMIARGCSLQNIDFKI